MSHGISFDFLETGQYELLLIVMTIPSPGVIGFLKQSNPCNTSTIHGHHLKQQLVRWMGLDTQIVQILLYTYHHGLVRMHTMDVVFSTSI
jgi:hypothetical protein